MKVLVACEESQRVCISFRKRGHEAFSCDLLPCSGGHPEWHIQCNVLSLLESNWDGWTEFFTQDNLFHGFQGGWDLIIAHPPCTYLSNAGAARLYPQKAQLNKERYIKGLEGKKFFMQIFEADCPKICIENPIPSSIYELPPYNQIIQPWQFGHPYSKKTCLWLKGLPPLMYTDIIQGPHISWVSGGSKDSKGNKRKNCGMTFRDSKTKSKTFWGIARAMAEQWG